MSLWCKFDKIKTGNGGLVKHDSQERSKNDCFWCVCVYIYITFF